MTNTMCLWTSWIEVCWYFHMFSICKKQVVSRSGKKIMSRTYVAHILSKYW